jgi:hypothetical protein
VKERRSGPIKQAAGLAETVAGAIRRRREQRGPRVVVYDASGRPQVLAPDAPAHGELIETAARLLSAAAEPAEPPPGRRDEASETPENGDSE